MQIPQPPKWRPQQRYDGRFWETASLMELLAVRYGATKDCYARTREYRVLIAVIRSLNSANAQRKGYGLDWKCLRWEKPGRQGNLVKDSGFAIKSDVLEYATLGRIPLQALQFACEHLREIEIRAWVQHRVETCCESRLAEAAE